MKIVESLAEKYIQKGMHLGEDGLNENKYLGHVEILDL